MNCVEIKNLTKKFENNVALENINLNLEKGKRVERDMFMVKIGHAFQLLPLNNNLQFINNLSKHVIVKKLHTRC